MPVERDDWDDGPPDTPAPVPAKEQGISRPDWDGTQPEAETPSAFPIEASKPAISLTDRPDWPLEPAEPETRVAEEAPVVDTPPLAQTMIAELAETGEHDLGMAHEAVQATLDAVPIADRAGFEAGFDGLPPGAQKAIIGELASPRNEWETLADEDELESFSSTPEGAELVQEWADDADVNLGRVQARLSRIEANTSPAAIETMWDWFDALPSAQAKAVLQVLAQ